MKYAILVMLLLLVMLALNAGSSLTTMARMPGNTAVIPTQGPARVRNTYQPLYATG